jgi:hypothetical protein
MNFSNTQISFFQINNEDNLKWYLRSQYLESHKPMAEEIAFETYSCKI